MLPNVLLDVIEDEEAPYEFMDALLKQHEAEQRLRRYSGVEHAAPPTVIQKEVISLMLNRAEKEIELLRRALNG